VNPPGEAKADFDIFLGLAEKLGVRDELFPGWTKPGDAFEEWKRVSKGRLCDYSGMTYRAIEQHGGIQWPFREGETNPGDTRRLYTEGIFQTESGRANLIPTSWEPFPEQPSNDTITATEMATRCMRPMTFGRSSRRLSITQCRQMSRDWRQAPA